MSKNNGNVKKYLQVRLCKTFCFIIFNAMKQKNETNKIDLTDALNNFKPF